MAGQLVIVAYRALVGGLATRTVDIQVRWFAGDDPEQARQQLESEPALSYRNPDGQVVYWEFSGVLVVEPFDPQESGEEVVGFIASAEELCGSV
ncbi:MAG TPA: hypothetical protein VFT74_19530 [Isosphaeraceae bacterium]|nr:hypothetical protein [Isosphaeraceae bacterium]